MFRGDAHKFYIKLKKTYERSHSFNKIEAIREVTEIQHFYLTIDSDTLEKILYRMIKEKNGSGIIPIFVSTGPWLLFLFSEQLQKFIFSNGILPWGVVFVLSYIVILTMSVILHFREKAWASFHIAIIKDILESKN
ncbi:hypothetical protein MUO14_11855 [Halobacillus shinanisalinarum]|uniref:Uncharacterized protein n=1 Tax=Halobacillus shinanisalinarum TaxID=2932258 RepID=A0ABY4H503_9BACI|nr:hypothetical protein [Halobacillus shinanisalinarum]UOQ95547.1 hypothetical protein MUO14_11855 [Halobacillus shinanisalinarum]